MAPGKCFHLVPQPCVKGPGAIHMANNPDERQTTLLFQDSGCEVQDDMDVQGLNGITSSH